MAFYSFEPRLPEFNEVGNIESSVSTFEPVPDLNTNLYSQLNTYSDPTMSEISTSSPASIRTFVNTPVSVQESSST